MRPDSRIDEVLRHKTGELPLREETSRSRLGTLLVRQRYAALLPKRSAMDRRAAVPKFVVLIEVPHLQELSMRLNGVEPSRPVRDTRPSTLRVYQFRHSRVAQHLLGDSVRGRVILVAG